MVNGPAVVNVPGNSIQANLVTPTGIVQAEIADASVGIGYTPDPASSHSTKDDDICKTLLLPLQLDEAGDSIFVGTEDDEQDISSSEEGEWLDEDSEYDNDSYYEETDSEREDGDDEGDTASESGEEEEDDFHTDSEGSDAESTVPYSIESRIMNRFGVQGNPATKRKASLSPSLEDVTGQPPRKYSGHLRSRSALSDITNISPSGTSFVTEDPRGYRVLETDIVARATHDYVFQRPIRSAFEMVDKPYVVY